jgi:hypothetical protein
MGHTQGDGDMLSTPLSIFVFASAFFVPIGPGTIEGKGRTSGATAEAGAADLSWLRRKILFSGENSQTADRPALSLAREMYGKVDPAEIWKKTGWGKDKAGSWIYEISDEDARITQMPDLKKLAQGEVAVIRLGDLLNHPLLFKAYPHLVAVLVNVYNAAQVPNEDDPDDAYEATTTPARIWRPASIEIAGRISNFLPTLIHEVQHILEAHEGLDYGPYTASYDDRIGEVRARNVERRLHMTAQARRRQPPHTTSDTPLERVQISPHRAK